MPSRKTAHAGRNNSTAHRRAVARSQVKRLISKLNNDWDHIDRIERGERLLELVRQGCSPRGLANDIGRSATNIRRHMTLASLPDKVRHAVRAGHSAKKILAEKSAADRQRRTRERVAEDARTGQWSDGLADEILEFCRTKVGFPHRYIYGADFPAFLSDVRNELWRLEAAGAKHVKLGARLNQRQRFKLTRPPEKAGEDGMDHRIRWLAGLMMAGVTERPIRELALEKAGRRGKELQTVKTPLQIFQEKRQWLADLPNVPRRKVYEPAARNPRFRTARPE